MAICDHLACFRWLCLEYLIVCIVGSLSQRPCTNNTGFIETSSYFLEKDTEVYPVQYGDCSFGQSLCNYTQFCTDPGAEDWRQTGDHAECPGKSGMYDSFSVLLSPLLHISHVTCLTFEFTQVPPGRLSVYMATRILVFSVMPEEVKQITSFISHQVELSNTTGKLAFRARSANPNDKVQLRGVKLQPGSCTGPDDYTLSTCGWTLDNWRITVQLLPENVRGATSTGYFVYVIYPTIKATLTTTLVQSTGSQTGCLEFSYIICGRELRLLVSIQSLDGNRRAVWVVSSNTSTDDCSKTWQQAAVPVSSSAAFTLMFENVPTDKSSGVVAVDSVRYTTQPSPSVCPLAAQHALPRDDDVRWSLPLSSTQRLSGDISTVTESAVDNQRTTVTSRQSGLSGLVDVTTVLQSQSGFSSSANKMAVCHHVTWCRWLYLEYLILCIVGSLSQKPCTNNSAFIETSSYFLGKDTEAPPVLNVDDYSVIKCTLYNTETAPLVNLCVTTLSSVQTAMQRTGDKPEMTTTESVDPPALDIGSGWIDGEANKNCLPNVKKWTGRSIQNFSPPFKTGVICDSSTSASTQFFHYYHAECPGKSGMFNSFSVLLSPLLHISHVTCLTFEYTQDLPGRLSVYLATRIILSSVMPEDGNETPNFISHEAELSNTTGKLAFRARSADTNKKVQLRGVKLQPGSCTGPACSFEDENTLSTCGWTVDNWDITFQLLPENVRSATSNEYFVYVIYPTIKATLTTTLVQSTGSQTGCLEFSYITCGRELRLLVSIQSLDGNRRAVWVVSSNTSTVDCLQTWQQASVPLSSSAAFTVKFENVPTDSSSGVIAVDSVRYTTQPSPSVCPLAPQHALPRDDDIISTLPTSSTQKLSGSISTVSGTISTVSESVDYEPASTTTFLQSTSSWLEDVAAVSSFTSLPQNMSENSNSDQTTPIIAGVVSAVVIVIACIVAVVIIVIRKRRQNLEGAKIISDDTNGNANDVHYASEHSVVEKTIEDREDRAAVSDPESDPYDVAEDGIPGITRSALSGNRGYILSPDDTARSCSISQKNPKQRKRSPEMHSAVHNQQKGEPEVYSQVRKEKKEAQEVYSLVNKQRKEEINKSSGHGSTALLNPSYTPEIYELAKRQPTQAMADTADDQEYNALNFDLDRQVGESTHPREATGQTYDHLHGDVLYDCAKVEHNPHGVNMVIDAEYNHLV